MRMVSVGRADGVAIRAPCGCFHRAVRACAAAMLAQSPQAAHGERRLRPEAGERKGSWLATKGDRGGEGCAILEPRRERGFECQRSLQTGVRLLPVPARPSG